MLFPPRALALVLVLSAIPQAPRAALDRCAVSEDPVSFSRLPDALAEVSGLAAGPGGTLLAHSDERGRVTVLDIATMRIERATDLAGLPRDDFEGIAASGDSVALMTSAGRLYFLRLAPALSVPFTRVETGLGKDCELEGLAWDRTGGMLILPCKQPKGKAQGGLTLYRYRLRGTPGPAAPIVVSPFELGRATKVAQVRATSVEIDPPTGHLIVLSSKPPMLIEIDTTGRIVSVRHLAARYHVQAEGMTLTADALWIADEGAGRKGTLARYACK